MTSEHICKYCGNVRSYSKKHNTYYCVVCNFWFERACNDKNCKYCKDRPEFPIEEKKEITTEIVEIDCVLIRQLKQSGRRGEANDLLKAWRENVEENKKQVIREIKQRDRKIKRHFNICTNHNCNDPHYKYGKCLKCYKSTLRSKERRKHGEYSYNKYISTVKLFIRVVANNIRIEERTSVTQQGEINITLSRYYVS